MDRTLLKKVLRDLWRVDRIAYPRVQVLTVAHDTDRSYQHAGRWYSPMMDTIEDDLRARGVSCVSVARVISEIKGDKAYGRVVSPEGGFARALIGKRIKALFQRGQYPFSHMERNVWRDILQSTGARFVLAIQPSRELCSACHELGVWVADVQHGVIGQAHPWYGSSYRRNDPPEQLPSAFLVWDHESAEVIRSWASQDGPAAHIIGNRWLARFAEARTNDELVHAALRQFAATTREKGDKPAILVTLSWGTTDIPNGFITEALCNVIRQTSSRYKWMVRLHPNQINGFATNEGERFPSFSQREFGGAVEWDAPTRAPLPAVLRETDLHICWNSSSCIEAAMLGIRSAMLDPELNPGGTWEHYYSHYRALGIVEVIADQEAAILQWLDNSLRLSKTPATQRRDDATYLSVLQSISIGTAPQAASEPG